MSQYLLPIALAGGIYYMVSGPKCNCGCGAKPKKKKAAGQLGPEDYHTSLNPVADLKSALMSNAVRGKDVKLLRTERGPEGTIKHVYYLPSSNQLLFSAAPLEMHQAL